MRLSELQTYRRYAAICVTSVINLKLLKLFHARSLINADLLPVVKGFELNANDKLHHEVITKLICHFNLSFAAIEQNFSIKFSDYFSEELKRLEVMRDDGLLTLSANSINILPAGRLLIRNICMIFDRYLTQKQQQFSKVI